MMAFSVAGATYPSDRSYTSVQWLILWDCLLTALKLNP